MPRPTINIDDPFVLSRMGEEIDKVTRLPYEPVSLTDAEKAQMQANIGTPAIEMDETPSPYSTNPVTSRGIYEWVRQQIAAARTLDHIVIKNEPAKTTYEVGEHLDLTGIAVAAFFTDGFEDNVTDDCTFSPADGALLPTIGEVTITATYIRGTITRTATTTIEVQVAETPYLKFSSPTSFNLHTHSDDAEWDGTMEVGHKAGGAITWSAWDGTPVYSQAEDTVHTLYVRGTNTDITHGDSAARWVVDGSNVTIDGCISALFDYQHYREAGDIRLANGAMQYLFAQNDSIISPAPMAGLVLADYACASMYAECDNLERLPEITSPVIGEHALDSMFAYCPKIKMSATRTGSYQTAYTIPTGGQGTGALETLADIFTGTGGTKTGNADINGTYYTQNAVVPALA